MSDELTDEEKQLWRELEAAPDQETYARLLIAGGCDPGMARFNAAIAFEDPEVMDPIRRREEWRKANGIS